MISEYNTEKFLQLSKEVLGSSRAISFCATGASMYPFIRNGELIQIKVASPEAINKADIVLYQDQSDRLIVHRVVKKYIKDSKIAFLTKGDASSGPDSVIYFENILGKVIAVRKGKFLIRIDHGFFKLVNLFYELNFPLSRQILVMLANVASFFISSDSYSRENKLLVLLSGVSLDEGQSQLVKEALEDFLDWEYILARSREEGIICLVYKHLDIFSSYVPAVVLDRLRNFYYTNFQRNARILDQAGKMLKAFKVENIPAIALKGIFLAENIYGNIALRSMTDIDILIRQEDIPRAHQLLTRLGYAAPRNYQNLSGSNEISPSNSFLYRPKDAADACIHLHWHLINSTWPLDNLVKRLDMKRVWLRAEACKVSDIEVLALCPEHLMLYLAQHAFHHSFKKLISLTDFRESFVRMSGRINWKLTDVEAESSGLVLILRKTLNLTFNHQRFGVRLKWSYPRSYLTYFFIQENIFGKLRFLFRTIFPVSQVMASSLEIPASAVRAGDYYDRLISTLLTLGHS